MVEDVNYGFVLGFRAVQHGHDRTGHVQTRSRNPTTKLGDERGVLRRALHQGQGMLGPVDIDAQRHDAGVLGEVHPVDHDRHQVQSGQISGQQVGQGLFGGGLNFQEPRDNLLRQSPPLQNTSTGTQQTTLDQGR